ncbi:MAG: site-specific integrase [Candidatus Tectomicrobia bacterium]
MATIVVRDGLRGRRYQVRIRLHEQTRSATFHTKRQAQQWAATTEGAIFEERYLDLPDASRYTLGDLIERYRRDVLPKKSPGTARNDAQYLAWWSDRLGDVRLHALKPVHVAANRDRLALARQPATVNRYLAILSHAFSVAITEWDWLSANPLQRVKRLPEPRGRVRFLSDVERRRLLEVCTTSAQPLLLPVVVLALSTGARKMELLGLTWRDVDLRRGQFILEKTKNRERRAVPLTGRALAMMQELARVRRIDTALCFPRRDGRMPIDLRYAWAQALAAAQIADFRFHDLRHSAASYLAMNGASLVEIAEVLGHKTLQMVKRYAHLSEAHTTRIVATMNAAIFESYA